MKTILIQSNSEEDARFVMKFARKMRMKARWVTDQEMEDRWLGKMIDDGMKEKGEIPLGKFLEKIRKNGSHR